MAKFFKIYVSGGVSLVAVGANRFGVPRAEILASTGRLPPVLNYGMELDIHRELHAAGRCSTIYLLGVVIDDLRRA